LPANQGNKGHGTSIFGLITNQPSAPKGVVDSDAYSHISFVRTLQDMFQLSDPGDAWSYMNRIQIYRTVHRGQYPQSSEYALSADPHFDARPADESCVPDTSWICSKERLRHTARAQVGPDSNQINPWA
jgi:hypothetical protein